MRIKNIMTQNPVCCTPETSLEEAARLMQQHDCGALPVVDENGYCVGIVTQADVARHASTKEIAELLREVSHV